MSIKTKGIGGVLLVPAIGVVTKIDHTVAIVNFETDLIEHRET